jgi:hypothetical protein
MEARSEQKTETSPLTSEQSGEQPSDIRFGAGSSDRPGLRLVPRNSAGDLGINQASAWPVVSNLALVPALTSEQQKPLTSEQSPLLTSERKAEWNQPDGLLTSEQLEEAAKWLWSLLPKPSNGWWDAAASGKGFIIKQRWRVSKKQETQTYPRISREQFLTLRGMSDEKAKEAIADTIAGHLDDIIATDRDRGRREKARRAAARLNVAC